MAAGLMRQKPKVFQRHFKHHLLNLMFCRTCQPFVHIYYCLCDSSAELHKTHGTLWHVEQHESAWWPTKATQP